MPNREHGDEDFAQKRYKRPVGPIPGRGKLALSAATSALAPIQILCGDRGGIKTISLAYCTVLRYLTRARLIVGLGVIYNAVGISAAFMGYISPLVAAVAMPIFSTVLLILSYTALPGIAPRE